MMCPKIQIPLVLVLALIFPHISPGQRPPVPVFVAVAERKFFTDDVEALGTLKANENVDLTTTVVERVVQINFTDGQRVRKGQLLVKMDAAGELALKAEEVFRIQEARRQVERLAPLVKWGAASESLLDARNRELQTAEARLAAIQSQIDRRRIRAPFSGVVGLRNISVGALVQPGTLMHVVLNKNPRDALVVPEEALIPNGGKHFVFLAVKNGEYMTVERRAVIVGARRQGEVEVLSGIREGNRVVTHGKARPGEPVIIRAVQKDGRHFAELLARDPEE